MNWGTTDRHGEKQDHSDHPSFGILFQARRRNAGICVAFCIPGSHDNGPRGADGNLEAATCRTAAQSSYRTYASTSRGACARE
jgi:hypothetical protein